MTVVTQVLTRLYSGCVVLYVCLLQLTFMLSWMRRGVDDMYASSTRINYASCCSDDDR